MTPQPPKKRPIMAEIAAEGHPRPLSARLRKEREAKQPPLQVSAFNSSI